MKIKNYFFSLILLLVGSAGVQAQMTIGNSVPSHGGALLDLQQPNASTKMGLKLPVVSLADASQYGLTSGESTAASGMVVYNNNPNIANGHGVGVYVWDGTKWHSTKNNSTTPDSETSILTVECEGLIFMDRNLGASASAEPNPAIYDAGDNSSPFGALNGDYYQWGRIADGHEKWNSPVVDGPASVEDSKGQIPSTNSTYYGKFIVYSEDWKAIPNDDLWNGSDGGLGNPCPNGFRVPTKEEWTIVNNAITVDNLSALTPFREGINVGSSNFFLPAAGYRNSWACTDQMQGVGERGDYSTSTPYLHPEDPGGDNCYVFLFESNINRVHSAGYRSDGQSVRCVKK